MTDLAHGAVQSAAKAPRAIAATPTTGAAVLIAALGEEEELESPDPATAPVGEAARVCVIVSPLPLVVVTIVELAEAPEKNVVVSTSVSTSPSSLHRY